MNPCRSYRHKLFGDHAGHLIADWFGGSPKLDNLISQSRLINQRGYAALERRWAKALSSDPPGHVGVDIRIDTDPITGRPNPFDVESLVNDEPLFQRFYQ
ncbi:DNA/RNA non-specific endonuclease [Clavibacter tessellarius]|uniref:DNA/RNA non-specific endonuclease n=1 Tax=Clavibacter TaxID=1573 RepID=UPI001C2FAA4D